MKKVVTYPVQENARKVVHHLGAAGIEREEGGGG